MKHTASARVRRDALKSWLFPRVPRGFPFRRALRTALRALHIFAGGTLVGGLIFNQPEAALSPWVWGTVASGMLLLMTDLYASLAVLCEVRGLMVLLKLGLMAAVSVFWEVRLPLLIAALVIGAVSSHMPGEYRHRVLFLRGHVVPDTRKG